MSVLRQVLGCGALGLAVGFVSSALYVACWFSELLAKLLMVPMLYVAFWPGLLLDVFTAKQPPSIEHRPLGASILLSLLGWLVVGMMVGLVRALMQARLRGAA